MRIAVKYYVLENDMHERFDFIAFLCKDGVARHLSLGKNYVTQQSDGSFLMKASCNYVVGNYDSCDKKLLEGASVLYWGEIYKEYDRSVWIEEITVYLDGETFVTIQGSIRINFSNYSREVCREKHLVLDKSQCEFVARERYFNNVTDHMPEAEEDSDTERITAYWYQIASEEDDF